MPILHAPNQIDVFVPIGEELTVTASPAASAYVSEPVTFSTSATVSGKSVTFGPFTASTRLRVRCTAGSVQYAQSELDDARWDDLRFPAQGINPAGAAGPPTVDDTAFPGTLLFSGSAENTIAGVAQMPHRWKIGSAIRPHIHYAKTTSAAGGVVWQWRYRAANAGDVFPAYSAWTAAEAGVPHSNTADKHAIDSFPELDMTNGRESALICWQIRRLPSDAADTYSSDVRFFEFDLHYQSDKNGTVGEFPDIG